MNESNSVETQNLNDQAKLRLIEINKIKDYFNAEIEGIKAMSKKLSKYIAAIYDIDKTFIVLFAISGEVSVISFTSGIGIPAGIASARFTLAFCFY